MSKDSEVFKNLQEDLEKMQSEVSEKTREVWLAGLGIFSTASEEGNKLFQEFLAKGKDMVHKGEEYEEKAKKFGGEKRDEASARVEDAVKFMEEKFNSAVNAMGFTSKDEVHELNDKVDRLTAAVAELSKKLEKKGSAS